MSKARKGEILNLKWNQVNLQEKKIELEAGTIKNDDSRIVYLCLEVYDSLMFQKSIRDFYHPKCPVVFFNYRTGEKIYGFRTVWVSTLKKIGLEGKLFHDFRRTAVRNMIRAGVPENVAMKISGHRTRTIFDRYNIVNEDDLKNASTKIAEYLGV